ncbi:hypothetical protein BIW11_10199 [Tropilaelaps mercedesae]|uniref:Condensin-2 complex subunit H2 C-terminal domain-containing protein n=1 Tax=Tropilaelaps mercedesae TaxID=418985 RepID=A0A1V9XGV5_9ACAR|nr:hypothetical protein BIW11_10199 [Tropilaelaps mercedesae]
MGAERCTSPNEHVELIRELESTYAEMLKPIRDLNKNFAVSLDVLEKYIKEVRQISIDTINFANAGLILQSSKEVYARKVDYLEKLFEDLQRTAYNVKKTENDEESNNPDESAKAKRAKKRKALIDGLDEYKLISPDDIPQLGDGSEMNFNNVGLTYITQLRACLLKPEVSVHVELRDVNGDPIGRKNDFRVNWPINQDGMPLDLTLGYYEERQRNRPSDRVCDELSDRDDGGTCGDDSATPPRNSPAESMFGQPDMTSTPSVARHDPHQLSDPMYPLLASAENNNNTLLGKDVTEDAQSDLKNKRMRARVKKLPAKMTLCEFLHGKKRRSKKSAAKTEEKRSKWKEKKAKEPQDDGLGAEKVDCIGEGDVKEEGAGHTTDKPLEASSTSATQEAFSPPEGKPAHDTVEKRTSPSLPLNGVHSIIDAPELKDDALTSPVAGPYENPEGESPHGRLENAGHECPEREPLSRPASANESLVESVMDTGFSDDDLDVSRRGDLNAIDISRASSGAINMAGSGDQATPMDETIMEDGQMYKTGALELDPMNQRIRAWEERIMPILEELSSRPKFRLPDYANRLLSEMRQGEAVPVSKVVASTSKHEVSRNFVALLHLCNTRNIDMQNGNISLLSREYRLSAEDVESYE